MDGLARVWISVYMWLDRIFCGTFCAGLFRWKDSNSGRTGLDLGLVRGMVGCKNRIVLCRALLFASCSVSAGLLK